jgi:tape measure domain-containing protein
MEGGDISMSNNIDERIVAMKFNNGNFANGVADALKALDMLKKGLNLDGAKNGLNELSKAGNSFNLNGLQTATEGVSGKFIALATIGITALSGIAAKAIAVGTTLIKSLTIDPIKAGLEEYETNLNSIQTILANTQSSGTNLEQVKGALAELNAYSDKTIYNFGEMARNIGTFTAAGVKLDVATNAIKGIANLAALSGSNSQQASTAMYQLSQELAAGKVTLMGWNSVVNAGMGGQVFQDAIKETARSMGIGVDAIIAKNGSFRESLQEGWLTSEVLTRTLSKFTGDLTDDQLRAQGYTQDQIVSIQALAKTASDAATKVKTASQLVGTLQESVGSGWSNTFQLILGDFEEAPKLFTAVNTVLGGMISAQAQARNELITGWRDAGGRDSAIQSVVNIFQALMAIVNPIKDALRDIFPPATGAQLAAITKAIEAFTKGLILGKQAQEDLGRTAKGVFAVFDILFTIVGKIVGVLFNLFGAATKGGTGILGLTGNIGDFLVGVRDAIKSGEGLNKFFAGLTSVLTFVVNAIRGVIGFLFDLGKGLVGIDGSNVTGAFDKISSHFTSFLSIGDGVRAVFEKMQPALQKVAEFFAPMGELIGKASSQFANAIKNFVDTGNVDSVLDVLNVGLLGSLVIIIKKFVDNITKTFKGLGGGGGLVGTIKGVFGQLTETMVAMQGQIKAKTLLLIAGAIALLTASVVALSLIDSGKLTSALTGLTVMFTQLIGALAILDRAVVSPGIIKMPLVIGALIGLGIAVGILAGAVKKLSGLDWNELARGLVGMVGILGALVIVANQLTGRGPMFAIAAGGLVLMAAAVRILASAVTDLAGNSWESLAKGLGGVAVLLATIAGFTQIVGAPSKIIATATAMVILGGALLILAQGVKSLAQLDWNELARGLSGMAASLAIVAGAMYLMPKSMFISAAGLVVVGAALLILANAVGKFAQISWEEFGRSMAVMGSSLAILAVGLTAMTGTLMGAAALVVASAGLLILGNAVAEMGKISWDEFGRSMAVLGSSLAILIVAMAAMEAVPIGAASLIVAAYAIMILAPAIALLGEMSWDDIGRGMAVLGSALAILAVGGVLILPAIPGLIGLGIAVALLGVGVGVAAIGLAAFAVALTALAVGGGASVAVLVAAVSGLAALIPYVATQIGLGMIAIAAVIGDNGPTIVRALTTILLALIAAIVAVVPQLVSAGVVLIMALVNALVSLMPFLIDAGSRTIIALLDGIARNVPKMVAKGTDIIVALLNGIGQAAPRLMAAGVSVILDFINGLANTIRSNTSRFNAAGNNLASAIIDGLTSGIRNGVGRVVSGIVGVATSAINAAKNALGIHSPSKVFTELGGFMMIGMSNGINALAGSVAKSSENAAVGAIKAVTSSMDAISMAMTDNVDMTPVIRPVLDLSDFKKSAGDISGLLPAPGLSLDKISASVSTANTGYEQNRRVETDADGVPTGEESKRDIHFTQINNSPKALSPAELYRQTKSQLAVAKGELDK